MSAMWTVIVRDAAGNVHSRTPLGSGALTIGRGTGCNIVLLSAAVSRLHGRIAVTAGGVMYSDEGSSNGSFVDGKQIKAPTPLMEKQLVEVGEFKLSVERAAVAPAAASAPPPARPAKPGEVPVPTAADLELVSVAPAQPEKPKAPPIRGNDLSQSALPGFNFKIPEEAKPKHADPMMSASATHMLDAQIAGIQSRRQSVEDTMRHKRENFEKDWKDAMAAARDLQGKLARNPRVLYFVISRDGDEASVKLADGSRRGWSNLTLSRKHPVTNKIQDDVVWYGEFGEDPRPYHEPKEALEDFVRNIATKLA